MEEEPAAMAGWSRIVAMQSATDTVASQACSGESLPESILGQRIPDLQVRVGEACQRRR